MTFNERYTHGRWPLHGLVLTRRRVTVERLQGETAAAGRGRLECTLQPPSQPAVEYVRLPTTSTAREAN
jgi:hypothetical protein